MLGLPFLVEEPLIVFPLEVFHGSIQAWNIIMRAQIFAAGQFKVGQFVIKKILVSVRLS